MNGLTKQQVMKVVNRYIGVSGGYLGTFDYRTHDEFYAEYCGLDIETEWLEGTTRERFIHVLTTAPPEQQAAILEGVVECFPIGGALAPKFRTEELKSQLLSWASELKGAPQVHTPALSFDVQATNLALADAEALIKAEGAASAVDRVHTAVHAYVRARALECGLDVAADASITRAFKVLRTSHPAFNVSSTRQSDADSILKALASIVVKLNDVRNHASAAHPSVRLDEAEATLAVNAGRTILHYIDAKLAQELVR